MEQDYIAKCQASSSQGLSLFLSLTFTPMPFSLPQTTPKGKQ